MSTTPIKEYKDITEYGYIQDDKVYLKGYYHFKDREIGVVRDSDEESLQYFVNRFDMVTKKVMEVKEAVAKSENKGSYLMKLIHMRTYLAQYNGLGDFTVLYDEINTLEDEINEYIEKNREKNYNIKKALLKEAEDWSSSSDWKTASNKFKELKMNWIKTGSAHKEIEPTLSERFNKALERFYDRRTFFYQEQAKIIKHRVNQYTRLINQLRRINRLGGGSDFVQEVKDIQKEWREVGKIAKKKFMQLQNDFKRETTKFFNDLKRGSSSSYGARDDRFGGGERSSFTRRKTGVEAKKEILETAEVYLKNGAPFNISNIKSLQNSWKSLGKQPSQEDKELNLKFRIICNEIFESHFLERTAKNLHPDLYSKSDFEQLKIKLDLLRDSLRQDEQELDEFNYKYGPALAASGGKNPEDFALYQERNNFINKMKTKQRILKKLEDKLLAI
ncbi:DUF349 domain-containing protein [Algivirga pacifica]|uniref:DUF349 domain-containing protein n=1 Tax=Algivirga pacifica TaxID=1162670 RepID=A0ABP9D6D3_9BACT